MFSLIVQTILLLAIAFILGAILGCLLRNLFGSAKSEGALEDASVTTAASGAALAAGVAGMAAGSDQSTQTQVGQPIVPKPPMPVAPVAPAEKAKVETPAAGLMAAAPAKKAAESKKSSAPRKPSAPKSATAGSKKAAAPTKKAVAVSGAPDNLKLIRGIGPQNEGRLNNLGVTHFVQIAAWKRKDEQHFGEVLAFPGRIEREEWVKQAKVLAKGGATDFAKRVKSGSVSSSTGAAAAGDLGKKPAGVLKDARSGKPDNLTLIDGVGNAIEKKMFKQGIFHFDQISKMSKAELVWLGNMVGFPGRPERENWAGEAKVLAAGGSTEHSKKVERGQIKTSRKS